ncbi:hypothetical protein CQW23_35386 [Capsicum baccatum]|uniref:Uncharacterized protein n=1 Tax=Capsicum baccatum TaxID=33114 RepID=A0A2G2UW35_CAPBA|nr:hypothetical protein CQW23_35386 [Capsicum baccatum]
MSSSPSRTNSSHKLSKVIKNISRFFYISSSNNPSKSKRVRKKIPPNNCYSSTLSLYECNCQYHEIKRKNVQYDQEKLQYDQELWRNYDDKIYSDEYDDNNDDELEERKSLEQRAEEFIKRFYENLSLQSEDDDDEEEATYSKDDDEATYSEDDDDDEEEDTLERRQSLEQRAEEFIKKFYEDQSLQRQNAER